MRSWTRILSASAHPGLCGTEFPQGGRILSKLAGALAPGEYTVRVVKLTEALQSSLLVGGVRVYGGELLSRRRQRRAK